MAFDAATLGVLNVVQLKLLLRGWLEVPRTHRDQKENLIAWILSNADEALQQDLVNSCEERVAAIQTQQSG